MGLPGTTQKFKKKSIVKKISKPTKIFQNFQNILMTNLLNVLEILKGFV